MKLLTFLILLLQPILCFASEKNTRHLLFIENIGQVKDQYDQSRSDIDFKISSPGINVFIGNGQLHYQFHQQNITSSIPLNNRSVSMYRLDMRLLNSNANAVIIREQKGEYTERYYAYSGIQIAHSYDKIIYKDIYSNIDWVIYVEDGHIEYDFVVRKGGDPGDIKLQYNGATSLLANLDGTVTATTPMGSISESAPYSYQEDGTYIESSFIVEDNILSFMTAPSIGTLIIDPKLEWSTYYGGENTDYETEVACNDSGYVYIAGSTSSLSNIATIGSYQNTYGGGTYDVYLAKFAASGERLWGTYYGSAGILVGERFVSLACDHYNNVYVVSKTQSATGISTTGSHQELKSGGEDGFIVKFNGQGERLWATYYGGDSVDAIQSVTCDDSGNVIITGYTTSPNNISTPGSYQESITPPISYTDPEAFISKFDSAGVLQWGTYFGGSAGDVGISLTTDEMGCIYMVGETTSPSNIATTGAHQIAISGIRDAFLAKFNHVGERIWSTYYGGSGEFDYASGVAVDGAALYLSGDTDGPNGIATPGSYQPVFVGNVDVYLVKFDTAGAREWGTYYGGGQLDVNQQSLGHKLAINSSGDIFMTYSTSSSTSISSPEVPQENYGGGQFDVFLTKFNSSGGREWSTYFGSCGYDIAGGCATDNFGNVYISGLSGSDNMGTRGCHRYERGGTWDSYLAKFSEDTHQVTGDTELCTGSTATYYASFVPGAESYTWTLPNGWTGTSNVDTINVTVGTMSGIVSVVANKGCSTEPAQELFVIVHPLPVVNITLVGNVMNATQGYQSYQWYDNAGEIVGATADTYSISGPGDYYVIVTDTNGCTNQSNILPVSVEVIVRSKDVALYPNPNNGNFNLLITGLDNFQNIKLEIFDMIGRKVWSENYKTDNNPTLNVNITERLTNGQYVLKVKMEQRTHFIKFTKH